MIISNPTKKPISIPLQTFTLAATGTIQPCVESIILPDTIKASYHHEGDFADKVFGKNNQINAAVDQILSITTTRPAGHIYQHRTLQCQACIYNDTVFLTCPFVGTNVGLANWAHGDFQSCVTHLIDMAEEKTGCKAMVMIIDKEDKFELNTIIRALMYFGFELLNSTLYNQDAKYILFGYEF
ncbi:hypothetical protein BC941DRAFT_464233 [Chlamydoabsidia padenii]|nr:hypothetical protein BC941DRAFT_464233 [Chlamydoabsidia padenii]